MAIDWNGWKIDEAQAEAIKQHNSEAMNRFIIENRNRIKYVALSAFTKNEYGLYWNNYDFDDIINQIYVDLPYYNYADGKRISYSVLHLSLRNMKYGGYSQELPYMSKLRSKEYLPTAVVSADKLVNDYDRNSRNIVDYYMSTVPEYERDDNDYIEQIRPLLSKYLSPKELDIFYMKMQGYSYQTCAIDYGYKSTTSVAFNRAMTKIGIHYAEVIQALIDLGCEACLPFQNIVPEIYEIALERHKRKLEGNRAYKARKRAERQALKQQEAEA